MTPEPLLLRNVEVAGRPALDVRIACGRIVEIGEGLSGAVSLDGRGGALIPGLADHHAHLLATAAQQDSISLKDVTTPGLLAEHLWRAASQRPHGAWIRATGYHEHPGGMLDRDVLDAIVPDHPVRVQHQTGSLWVLNSPALACIDGPNLPPSVERTPEGRLTGRIWRGDAWLASRLSAVAPPLAPLGRTLASHGITSVTDASVTNDAASARILSDAAREGSMPVRLLLMSGGELTAGANDAFDVGPVKVLLDDHDLPDLDWFIGKIAWAHASCRNVAVHCVTAAELALALAAFDAAGARDGDRIEHGSMIPEEAIAFIARLGLRVITQPAFIFERGDRYIKTIAPREHEDLYRCASLIAAGVRVAFSSDMPYASPDPWAAMRAAVTRRTQSGLAISSGERVSPHQALSLCLHPLRDAGGTTRSVKTGMVADLCLLRVPLYQALEVLDPEVVAATILGGAITYRAADL